MCWEGLKSNHLRISLIQFIINNDNNDEEYLERSEFRKKEGNVDCED